MSRRNVQRNHDDPINSQEFCVVLAVRNHSLLEVKEMRERKCRVMGCDEKAILELCSEHETEFLAWKRRLTFRYGDKPNEWALLTSFLLSKHQKGECGLAIEK